MKSFVQKDGEDVAIVIYDAPLPPKYFRLNKKFIRTLFVVCPLLFLGVLLTFFLWGLGPRLKQSPSPSLPSVITETDSKIEILESEIKSLKESNKVLSDKLTTGVGIATADDPYLMVIKKPYGMQNLLAQNKVSLDQFQFLQDKNKVNFKFQIISSSTESKVTGHILVFMISETGLIGYPPVTNASISQGVKFSAGEPFSVSRLRPTNAEFFHQLTGDSVKFAIYIFSRDGDLLLIRETESFKIGPKS